MTHSLNTRLLTAAEFVTRGGIACDVGTDHAYLAAYLADNVISEKVIACDIALGPIESAKATVSRMGLEDSITVIQSDGLELIPDEGITDFIICGMGGELILSILLRADWLKRGVNLVLQPMTRASELREGLYENGFVIKSEKACRDGRFVYSVINAEYRGETRKLTPLQALIGGLDMTKPESLEYASAVCERLSVSSLGKISSNDEATREDGERELDLVHELMEIINEV
ncbi:MAG: SAM-dependent methyltransferase [Oscillospiraceae bacterium]|nr:SAM-dependent methyltransferase [Oscillospiraceae bacterium]